MKLAKITLKDFRGFPHEETFDLAEGKNLRIANGCREPGVVAGVSVPSPDQLRHWNVQKRLFGLAVTTLLANAPVTVPGGMEKTIGRLWQELLASKPYRHSKWQLRGVADAEKAFNEGFRGILPDVEKKAAEYIAYFAGSGLELRLGLPGVHYDGNHRLNRDRKFIGQELDFEVKLHGMAVPEWNDFLNEARLSALTLSLYLAGATLGNTSPPSSAGVPLRLLVLDDVLIGLDLANRKPVIELVEKEFVAKEWQVLLLTFDRAWYEVAKQSVRSETWLFKELFSVRIGDYERPLLLPDDDHLYRALAFLEAGQVKAAAVHVRTKFELVLKWACEELGLAVKYKSAPHKIPASDFWSAVKSATYKVILPPQFYVDDQGRLRNWTQPRPRDERVVPPELERRIEHAVSWVLNPLSHSQTVDHYRLEIEDAVFAVDELERTVRKAIHPTNPALPILRQMLADRLARHLSQLQVMATMNP